MAPQNLAPLSYASIIVGFISFAFTFFTFVRVFWETILTLWSAPNELERVLDNLRLELHEERAYLKSMIRRSKSRSRGRKLHVELGPLRLLLDSIRDLMNDFKKLEEPFLSEPVDVQEKDVERSVQSLRGAYAPMTLPLRWRWMQNKEDFLRIATVTTRIQERRIASDVTNLLMKLHDVQKTIVSFEDRLWGLEEHLIGERLSDGNVYVKRRASRRSSQDS